MKPSPFSPPDLLRAIVRCDEASRLFSEARDRRLSLRERLVLFVHECVCPPCRTHRRASEKLFDKVRRESDSETPAEAPDAVRRRVEEHVLRKLASGDDTDAK